MLKAECILPRLKIKPPEVTPLALPKDYDYLMLARDLIEILHAHIGCRRAELTAAFHAYEGDRLDYWIIRGLAQVLENRCVFANEPPVEPLTLRAHLFSQGPVTYQHDLLTKTPRWQRVAETATHFNLTTQQVEDCLFADLAEEKLLLATGEPLTPLELINRYNLEVARGLLYWARDVQMTVSDHYKAVFKYIKLFKLMHTVYLQQPQQYHIILHGPISPFVSSTIRYGVQFAKFLPALLLCDQWSMQAEIQLPGSRQPLSYRLDSQTPLKSHFKPTQLFDSRLEADFAAEFEAKYQGSKRQWLLAREDEVIVVDDTVMIPDFSLTHCRDGRRALIEIVGFWHPHYLQRKLEKIRQAQRRDLIVLVYRHANVAEAVFKAAGVNEVLMFAQKPVLKEVLAAAERCAV